MANRKISQFTELTAPASTDVLPILDLSESGAEKNKKITLSNLLSKAPDGSASAPAFSFNSDNNSGISGGSDTLTLSTAGVGRLTVSSAGVVTIPGNTDFGAGIDVTGNMTVTGTVDGRDIATDGTKLDGIATGAIADIVSDTSPQLGGALDVNGQDIVSTSNGDIELDPNGSGQVIFKGNSTKGSGQLKLNCETNAHAIIIKGPPHSAAANYTLTLPDNVVNGQFLKTDGSGNLSWDAVDLTNLNASNLTSGTVAAARLSTATTQSAGNNTTKIATTAFVSTAISNLINGAPAALDTLNELAAAMADDAAFSTTVTNNLATKLNLSGGQMTGNLTFSGSQTVDGRDLSVDGAKLDGIEAGATADQTASEILTLVKTVDGSGSGLDADLLDGQEGSYYRNASNINAGTLDAARIPTLNQDTTGSAATLTTARTINGVSFDGSADITVTAAGSTLTGTSLKSTIVTSSLTSVGTLTGLTVSGDILMTGTGAIDVAAGTTAQRPGSPNTGMFRYNSTTNQFEGYTSSGWGAIAGGGGSGAVLQATNGIVETAATISSNHTVTTNFNAMSAGPVTVSADVTIPSGSVWTIV